MNRGSMNVPTAPSEVMKNLPLFVLAYIIDLLQNYGAVVATVLAIVYGSIQIIYRRREHKAIMTQHAWREKWHEEGKYP